MIRSFIHKGLSELWSTGRTAAIDTRLHKRIFLRLDRLDAAQRPSDMNVPGFDFHQLKGSKRYTVHVNGPWCVTFEFDGLDACRVDFEQYH
jgi:proteic killer suppression protein